MRSLRSALLLAVVSATPAGAAFHEVLGKSFVAKDASSGTDATRRRVVAIAKQRDAGIAALSDPRTDGAAVAVEVDGLAQIVDLPAAGWIAQRSGYRYSDRAGLFGPIERVILRHARGTFMAKITASGRQAALSIVPPNPGTEGAVAVVVRLGDTFAPATAVSRAARS